MGLHLHLVSRCPLVPVHSWMPLRQKVQLRREFHTQQLQKVQTFVERLTKAKWSVSLFRHGKRQNHVSHFPLTGRVHRCRVHGWGA